MYRIRSESQGKETRYDGEASNSSSNGSSNSSRNSSVCVCDKGKQVTCSKFAREKLKKARE